MSIDARRYKSKILTLLNCSSASVARSDAISRVSALDLSRFPASAVGRKRSMATVSANLMYAFDLKALSIPQINMSGCHVAQDLETPYLFVSWSNCTRWNRGKI